MTERTPPFRKGDRIRLIEMVEDLDPIPPGTFGTVNEEPMLLTDCWAIPVQWENGRTHALLMPPDEAEKE
jgi:hypothetical protein